ncbi:TY-Chap domain-containing protein [Actinomadura oligospora]|uniref:TY-Chap domain-containing protein n=1 Tax=Actinomadura oligospora TaxID=111804 RepID=UPI00047C14BB|nr:SseB family protein [Actinomadura oligospora]
MDWSDFADRLAAELVRLPDRAFLIVQGPTGLPYTQVLRADRALHAEAVGDAFLPVPLTARQERKLSGHGWNEPDDEERLNWWIQVEAPEATRPRPCGDLAKRMTGALREAYGVRSPRELVYQAGMTGPDGGTPLALPALGIPSAVPDAEYAPTTGALSGEAEAERALTVARERGDQEGYLELLARTTLYLPTPGSDGEGGRHFATAQFGGGTFVLAFTSPEAMDRSLRGQAVHHQTSTVGDLVRDWPHPDWRLAVNPGLPSASYLDTHMLSSAPNQPLAPSPVPPGLVPPGPVPSGPVPPASGRAGSAGGVMPPDPSDKHVAGRSRAAASAPQVTRLERLPQTTRPDAGPQATRPDSVPAPTVFMVQKVVRPEHVTHYLDGGYDLVAGYVHKLQDVADLTRPEGIVRALGLDQPGSPFEAGMDEMHVIRWPAVKPALFRSAPGEGSSVPGFKVESQRLPHGAEMHRLAREGRPTLVAVYDADLRRWRIRLATARGADKPRTPRSARRADSSGARKSRTPTTMFAGPATSSDASSGARRGLAPSASGGSTGRGAAEASDGVGESGPRGAASGGQAGVESGTRPSETRPDAPRGRHARGGGWE